MNSCDSKALKFIDKRRENKPCTS